MIDQLDDVCAEVLRSRRYRWIAPDLVRRLAQDELALSRNRAEAAKRTKRRLHQICGAYLWEIDPVDHLAQIAAARAGGDAALKAACRQLMARHASTRERLPILDRFYGEIFAVTGRPHHILDVACGLGPLAIPWMDLPAGAHYRAYEIDRRLVELTDGFLSICGVPHAVELLDVAASPPAAEAGVTLVLKTLPCLEQQAPGSARRLLDALHAPHVVISYPTRSLGGAAKGMVEQYRVQLLSMANPARWKIEELLFPSELVFVLEQVTV